MEYPTLPVRQTSRELIDAFGGYNHQLRIGSGEFYDMKNLTSDFYPVLSPRKKRGLYGDPEDPQGLISKDALCYVDGTDFVMSEYRVDLGLTAGPKSMTSMGAYVIIMPDKKWINTIDLTEYGNIEASFQTAGDVTITLCDAEGAEYTGVISGEVAPTEPGNLQLWMDTGSKPHTLKQYSTNTGVWVTIATTYVKIHNPNLGKAFSLFDGVTISGILDEDLQDLNGSHVVWAKGDDYIVTVGLLDVETVQQEAEGKITIERKMPEMDFLIESENRLWGCRYGIAANGEVVNEIYASKLGDFKNWNCFMGVSTDSYAASCGTDGRFTGAITHLGYPLFFKENFVHKVYGNYPANFQIQATPLRGVQRGCERSLAIVNEVLYYKSQSGVCAYDGSLPVEVSSQLGDRLYDSAVAGSHGNKYYISMRELESQQWQLLVYDTRRGMWHKEDSFRAEAFCSCREELYAISGKKIYAMLGSGTAAEKEVKWMAQTGEIGLGSPDHKYISRLVIRMKLAIGAQVRILAKYDEVDQWVILGSVRGTSLRSFRLPVRPRRCDHLSLKFEGRGEGLIYSITKTIEEGSDGP